MRGNTLKIFDGFAQIQPLGYSGDPDIRKTIDRPEQLAAKAETTPGVDAAAPRATTYVILANDDLSFGGALVGVDPQREASVSTLHNTMRAGRFLAKNDTNAIVMGDVLARDLKIQIGGKVTVLGSALDGSVAADSLVLIGTFHTGMNELDRQIAEMPLARFQATFGMGNQANIIVLMGRDLRGVTDALPAITKFAAASGLTVRNWGELEPALKQAITLDFSTAMLWYVSLVVVVVFITLNTLLMSVLERTREFGMLLALGMQSYLVGRMLWLELLFLAVIGNTIGILLGGGASLWFESHGIVFSGLQGLLLQWGLPGRLYPSLTATSALAGPLVIVLAVATAGLVPYRRILKLEPLQAMRTT
jgi:ABC-type lipoprotein release transport system permease subunit